MPREKLILASSSPRRRQLLEEAGYAVDIMPPAAGVEEDCSQLLPVEELVVELARRKAADVARHVPHGLIVACDTLVECKGFILGKPRDLADARQMLGQLRGNDHRVLSGLCVWRVPTGKPRLRTATTVVHMDPLSDGNVEAYLQSGLWSGKAGAFGYQDRLGWVHVVQGSESNVVGLPMELLGEMLQEVGLDR